MNLLSSVEVDGVRKLAIYEDFLFISRGEINMDQHSDPILFNSYLGCVF